MITDSGNTTNSSKENYEFVTNITHELKTPLTSIIGFIEFLKKDDSKNKKTREYFYDIIDSEAQRLLNLIDNVLLLSQIENNKTDKILQDCNVEKELNTILRTLSPLAKSKRIELRVNLRKKLKIKACSTRLQQLFSNLVSNAIKYNVPGGKIFIDAFLDKNFVTITVKDTGIGIEPEHINKIFDRFYRVSTENTSNIPGNGLGLSIVKDIVTMYGGTIKINSEVGQGSEFIVCFPVSS